MLLAAAARAKLSSPVSVDWQGWLAGWYRRRRGVEALPSFSRSQAARMLLVQSNLASLSDKLPRLSDSDCARSDKDFWH